MANSNLFPEIIAITLYKYNSIDNKIYTLIMNNCQYTSHRDTILVRISELDKVIKNNFKQEINKIDIISNRILHKEANTIYFLNKIISEMKNLRWFQISLSKNAGYSRIQVSAENKILNFNFKVIRGSFRTFDFFKKDEISYVNRVLKEIGCIRKMQYSIVKLNSLANRLEKVGGNTEDQDIKTACARMLAYFDDWVDDNPEALIVTDYLDI